MSSPRPHRTSSNTSSHRRWIAAIVALALFAQPVAPFAVSSAAAQSLATKSPSTQLPSAQLPDLGDESQALYSPAQERKLGESVVYQIRAQGAYLDDPEVNDYLNELGHRLVAARPDSPWDFQFFALADPSVNAFALPGGFVGVNVGIILLTQNESELASVLAHEISHVTQHHFTRSMAGQQRSLLYSLAALAMGIAAASSKSSSAGQAANAAMATAQAMAIQTQINYTRQNEYEADRIGFQRLALAGFDTTAMATMFQRLLRQGRFSDGNAPSYLRDHPVTTERIAEAEARAAQEPYRQVPDSLDFQMVHSLVRSYQGTPREAVLFFEESLRERKYNSEIAARYGLVASLLRANDLNRAKIELVALEKIAPPHPMVEAMAGHVYMEAGDLDAAITRFAAALQRYPNKMQLVYDYPEALIKAKRPREAATFLSLQLVRFPDDGPLHRIAAQAYSDLGNQMEMHRHQGEYYAWQGDLKGAVAQLEIASKAGDGDFYLASVIDARLRTLRRELAEQQANSDRNG
jgi:predicted Zn-dependent protease